MSGATPREEFLAGERHDHVLFFLHEDAVGTPEALADVAETVEAGVVLVVPGDRGSEAFQEATGIAPMSFAGDAMDTEGTIARDCTSGVCPEGDDHRVRFVFAFSEAENETVGGIYARGDVVHAYAGCECGTTYSDRWTIDGAGDGGECG